MGFVSHPHFHCREAVTSTRTGRIKMQQAAGAAAVKEVKLCELRPSAATNVNTTFIILEKGPQTRVSEGAVMVCVALVADSTAAVHLQLWGPECEALQPSDIVRLTNGVFTFHKPPNLVLRAGKKGTLEKIGEFAMVFVEAPNMSRVQWLPDPANSKQWIPIGIAPQIPPAGHPNHGALLSRGGYYQDRVY